MNIADPRVVIITDLNSFMAQWHHILVWAFDLQFMSLASYRYLLFPLHVQRHRRRFGLATWWGTLGVALLWAVRWTGRWRRRWGRLRRWRGGWRGFGNSCRRGGGSRRKCCWRRRSSGILKICGRWGRRLCRLLVVIPQLLLPLLLLLL